MSVGGLTIPHPVLSPTEKRREGEGRVLVRWRLGGQAASQRLRRLQREEAGHVA
jgi:hypothetical protein